jgi:hypothetical protein
MYFIFLGSEFVDVDTVESDQGWLCSNGIDSEGLDHIIVTAIQDQYWKLKELSSSYLSIVTFCLFKGLYWICV